MGGFVCILLIGSCECVKWVAASYSIEQILERIAQLKETNRCLSVRGVVLTTSLFNLTVKIVAGLYKRLPVNNQDIVHGLSLNF